MSETERRRSDEDLVLLSVVSTKLRNRSKRILNRIQEHLQMKDKSRKRKKIIERQRQNGKHTKRVIGRQTETDKRLTQTVYNDGERGTAVDQKMDMIGRVTEHIFRVFN